MTRPQTLSLDGEDWTVYWLPPREWEGRRVWEQEPPEAAEHRIPARVPGHALDALLPSGSEAREAFYRGLHTREWGWVSERDWVFEKRFQLPEELRGYFFQLRFEGIDDTAHVFLNGERVGDHTGQFVPAEWEVSPLLWPGAENHLLVVVEHAPEEQAGRPWKTRFPDLGEGCPCPVQIGLWDSVLLRATGPGRFRSVAVYTNVSKDQTEAALSIVSELSAGGPAPARVVTDITQDGLPVTSVEDALTLFPGEVSLVQSCEIPRLRLWWPNGHGAQPLYQARVTLVSESGAVMDQRTFDFGVRSLEAVPCEGAPEGALPYGLRVNGKRIWIQGWNWVPLDLLYASVPEERYEHILRLAKDAHVNLLRVWGGGLQEKEVFYRLCDRFGIMVWQEFPQTGPDLPGGDRYVDLARDQAEAMLARHRNHPSLVLWSGGSDLRDADGRPLTEEHPVLAELRAAVETEDPQRLWLPTSPSGPHSHADPAHAGELHDVHGPYHWLGLSEHPEFYNRIDPLLHSAFGCEGAAGADTLPLRDDLAWTAHKEKVEQASGPIPDAETFIRASQLLQAMCLKYAIEAHRRRQWRCAGTLPWPFNQTWPHAVSASAVDYYGQPKPAYHAVQRAYAPFHVSAAFRTFSWHGAPEFRAEAWLHNSGAERTLLNVVATIVDLQGRELYQENLAAEAPENTSEAVDTLSWRFPQDFAAPFLLFLEVIDEEGETLARNHYLHSRAPDPPFAGYLDPALEERLRAFYPRAG